VVAIDRVDAEPDEDEDHPPPAADEVRQGDRDTGGERQLRAQPLEQGREGRNDLPEDDPHDPDRDRDDGDGIDHRGPHGRAELDDLLDVGRQALEDDVEDTAGLAGGDHVGVEVVERLRVLPQRVRERGTGLHVLAHLEEDLLEDAVVLLRAEDLQALHERQAGVDHDRELPGEDGDLLAGDPSAHLGRANSFPFSVTAVTVICCLRKTAITASLFSATSTPSWVLPARVRPFHA
jgi:hypothetical protein